MKSKRFFSVAMVACLLSPGLLAQGNKKLNEDPNTRSVTGVVTGGGAPVSGANVQLKDTKTLQIRSYVTHDDGTYHFAGLSTNVDYELKAEHDGHSSGTKTLSNFDGRKAAVIDLKLK
jgi:uncharacterized protein YdeI (BOF family)